MNQRPSPYVGPRPFEARHLLPARQREMRELRALLIAERVALLHAPSGAGKTSLIEARNGLRAALAERSFLVRPTMRVSRPVEGDPPEQTNRYVLSALRDLEEGLPSADLRASTPDLARMTLDGWLNAHPHLVEADEDEESTLRPQREALIFDQLEEILTCDPADDMGRREFFQQLALALEAPHRWALFVIREDYLGALEPWARLLPTHLAHRYRIDLLDAAGATEAIRKPALDAGVSFEDQAVASMVHSLSEMQVQGIDGRLRGVPGRWVEPVLLQVVCERLWAQLSTDDVLVDLEDVNKLGDVNQALERWYADTVREIASKTLTAERHIRDWVGGRLLSSTGVRTQVLRGEASTEGLDNEVLQALEKAHVIRGEDRQGRRWYELVHDRMVKPVRNANAAWRKANLQPFHLAAEAYARAQDEQWLLYGLALKDARRWALKHPSEIRDIDITFLEKSAVLNRRRTRERIAFLAFAAFVAIAAVLIAGQSLEIEKTKKAVKVAQQAVEVTQQAVSNSEQALRGNIDRLKATGWQRTAEVWLDEDPTRAMAALIEAAASSRQMSEDRNWQELAANLLARPVARQTLYGHTEIVNKVSYSPDGRWLLSVSEDGSGRAWTRDNSTMETFQVEGGAPLRDIATCGEVNSWWAAVASQDGRVTAFRGGDWSHPVLLPPGPGHDPSDGINVVALDPSCSLLLAGFGSGRVERWKYEAGTGWEPEPTWTTHTNSVTSINFSPDARLVVTTARDRTARVWSLSQPSLRPQTLAGGGGVVYASAFGEGGNWLYLASYSAPIRRWRVSAQGTTGQPQDLWRHSEGGRSVAAVSGQSGSQIATSGFDDDITLASEDRAGTRVILTPSGLSPQGRLKMSRVIFSPTGDRVFSYRADGGAHLWWTGERACSVEMRASHGRVTSAAFSPDGEEIATGYDDGTIYVWSATQPQSCASLYRDADGRRASNEQLNTGIRVAHFSQDGRHLAVIDGTQHLSLLRWNEDGRVGPAEQAPIAGVSLVALDADGTHVLLYRNTDRYLVLLEQGKPWVKLSLPAAARRPTALALSLDGQKAAFGDEEGLVGLWSTADPDRAHVFPIVHRRGLDILSLAFDPKGQLLVSGGEDGRVVANHLKESSGEAASSSVPKGHFDYVNSLVFSSDGRLLLSASDDLTARIWDFLSGRDLVKKLARHYHYLRSARFDAAGERVVTTGMDPTVRIWNWNEDTVILRLTGHTDAVLDAAFLDNHTLLTSSVDGTVRKWRIDQKVTVSELRQLTSACATETDRKAIVDATEKTAARDFAACQASLKIHGAQGAAD